MIKSYNGEHTCVISKKNVEATSDWIAKKFVLVLRDHPEMTAKGIIAEMLKFGVHPSRMQVYRAKKKALEEIEGSHGISYSKLPKYAELVRIHNPSSICKIHYDMPNLIMKEPRFLRMFISFKAQKDGFLAGCRPFVGFDGCYLKGPFGDVLLTAVALDGNNSLFPLAFAIAETENKETWSWFFHFFEEYFGPFGSHVPLTFMSDRQKGLNLAYEEKVPQADARYYCRHIYSNLKLQFPGLLLRNYFWEVAKSFDIVGHNKAKAKIKDMNIEAWKYLSKIPVSAWARHSFKPEIKCDHIINNLTESFIAWVGELRGKPIFTLAEGLRRKMMKKFHKRFQNGCTWTNNITPKVVKKMKVMAQQYRKCELMLATENMFAVRDSEKTHRVNLTNRTCECGAFQMTGLLCKHAALGIVYRREPLEA
ncbi:hypothetical protein ACH5RR_002893 [Cinchona calisaya]|uniref:SWIM-type domain-containing protein n=1 Tax=Cinchona calisaya TaxID=153742 RepID=A0ABD3ATX6_9GENT